ncbi:MAG: phenylacetate-CoA oxygenase/reductase subunit PaaK [Chitinophagaceae bacterium]|nr:MAG: phenylacetate-CoA oxygenase/reductase subunit PaaK [Chitinophagaceae bacterium]
MTFELPEELQARFAFRPGQHLTLRRVADGQDLRRTYSVCTSAAGGPLRVAVKRLEGGVFSTWVLDALRPGDVLEVLPPAGRFGPAVDPARARKYGLVAAGSGITPVLSIAWTVLDVEPESEVVLVYGNRTSGDVMFLEELADLKDRFPDRLQVLHVLSREEQESELLSGRIDRARLQRLLDTLLTDVDEWYLCGPFGMVTDGRQTLLDAGVDPSAVHVELFHADAPPPRVRTVPAGSADTAVVTVVLHGRTTAVSVPKDGGSVLDAVLAVRADAPFACKGGVCGTCRARCVSGSVEMDVNYALEPDELAAGVVLTCQSHPTSDEVRLEFL